MQEGGNGGNSGNGGNEVRESGSNEGGHNWRIKRNNKWMDSVSTLDE